MMRQGITSDIVFDPLMPLSWLIVAAIFAFILVLIQSWRQRRFPFMRALVYAAFLLAMGNPSLMEESRTPLSSVALIIVDESLSQDFDERTAQTEAALTHVTETLKQHPDIEARVVRGPAGGASASRSDLFTLIEESYADIPANRRAGVIFITDGQIHDAPDAETFPNTYGPVNALISGRKNERDRRINISEAPAFGIPGENIALTFTVEDSGIINDTPARVLIRQAGEDRRTVFAIPGEKKTIQIPVKHAGQNFIELSTEVLDGELTPINNKAAIEFQGVRDRLKVLLVSGRPHSGGRAWRDLLTSDPSVDLVHFTILRDPEKLDATPPSEMSLIAFPFRELFEIKLYDFDLIIFDRYSLYRILPSQYFDNIARYVKDGGGFLEVSGPGFAGEDSIYNTALGTILPAAPDGQVYQQSFKPSVSTIGQAHPVTKNLLWRNQQDWGAWHRQLGLQSVQGDVLLEGYNDLPLLILDRTGEGRVAQLASDQIWLWSRGYEGGGPYAELLRRTVHWLMKEPELDEQALNITVTGHTLHIERPDFTAEAAKVTMRTPDGKTQSLTLTASDGNLLELDVTGQSIGLYEFTTADGITRFAIVGEPNPPELRDVLSTTETLASIARTSEGNILRISENSAPVMRVRQRTSSAFGSGYLNLRRAENYSVTGSRQTPLLPAMGWLGLLCALICICWWREGRH